MNQTNLRTYLLVGHVTKDLHPDDSFTIGGTVTYASVVARQLGWRPMIVTAAAPEFSPPAYLADVDWRILPSPETTTFRNEYDPAGHRRQTIGPVAAPIQGADMPADGRQATLVHLCPLAQELTPAITDIFESDWLMATPQGWMRYWDNRGLVSLGDWKGAATLLPNLRVAVVSIEDIEGQWAIAARWAAQTSILIVTQGELGCTVFHRGQTISVPPRPAQPVDPTGAGDVFAAAFFIRYYETGDLWQSARFANVTASMSIERPGPEGAPHRAEIELYLAQHPVDRPVFK
jgi:sugar/nucleoside kinase (ribokinase family)